MASTKAKMLQGYYDEMTQTNQVKKKSPIVKPVRPTIPVKGDAVDRLTSYMETDAAIRTTPDRTGARLQAPAPKTTGIIPTTTNSITSPVQSAPVAPKPAPAPTTAPVAPQETSIQDMIQQMVDAKKTEEVPHYHPDLIPMNEDEMTEPIV